MPDYDTGIHDEGTRRTGDSDPAGGGRTVACTLDELRSVLNRYERNRARGAGWTPRTVPSGLAPLDAVLPRGGVPSGAIVEIFSAAPGTGAMSVAMRIAGRSIGGATGQNGDGADVHGRHVVFVDATGDFYPPAASHFGSGVLDRLIVVRATRARDAIWAVEQSLRCPAVACVAAPLERLDGRSSRRLQLAAESAGGIGLLLRSARDRGGGFAAIQLLIEAGRAALCRITVLKVREGMPAEPLLVDLTHETGSVPAPSLPGDRSVARSA